MGLDEGPIRRADDVLGFVARTFFKIGPPRTVGVELECLAFDPRDHAVRVPSTRTRPLIEAGGALPGSSLVTYEPGGQVELSTAPATGAPAAVALLAADLGELRIRLEAGGVGLALAGLDPVRAPRRTTDAPRYAAMEAYFDRRGPEGRAMMTNTAALQVSLDAGADGADVHRRWHTANELMPVLTAMFANSPLQCGSETGRLSSRARVWSRMDPLRTSRPVGDDPAEAYARYALEAPVMCLRTPSGPWLPAPGVSFGAWVAGALPSRPTQDDLEFHLTTLFPPVRAREWLELRGIDALPDPWWPVPVLLTEALLADPVASDRARAAASAVQGRDDDGARLGVSDPGFRRAAASLLEEGVAALKRRGEPAALLEHYGEHYVSRGRTPADDVLAASRAGAEPWVALAAPSTSPFTLSTKECA